MESGSKYLFKDVKKAFPHICWLFWIFSAIGSYCITLLCFEFCEDNYRNRKDVVKATLLFTFFFYLVGLTVALLALGFSTKKYEMSYPLFYFLSVVLFSFLGFWFGKYRFGLSFKPEEIKERRNPFSQDQGETSVDKADRPFLCMVFPCMFIAIHNVLWVMLGITTEPFWAIPVVTSHVAVALLVYLLILYCFNVSSENESNNTEGKWGNVDKFNLLILIGAVLSIVSVLFSFFLTGSHFFDNSLMSSTIPGILIVILSIGWKFLRKKGDHNVQNVSQNETVACD